MGSSQIPIDSSIGHGLKFPILAALTANSSRISAIVKRFFISSPRHSQRRSVKPVAWGLLLFPVAAMQGKRELCGFAHCGRRKLPSEDFAEESIASKCAAMDDRILCGCPS